MPNIETSQPYGQWQSHVSANLMASRTRFEDVQWTADGKGLVWLEGRGGQGVLVGQQLGDAPYALTFEHSVRGTVGYGGGEFTTSKGALFFACSDHRLYRQDFGWPQAYPITDPEFSTASPVVSPKGGWLAFIRSNGVEDALSLVDVHGEEPARALNSDADFYMQPAWHPSGEQIAWVEWDHPYMPWRESRVVLVSLDGEPPQLVGREVIAAEPGEVFSEPRFSADGRWMSYLASGGNWEKLVLLELASGERRVLIEGERVLLRTPAWIQGMRHTAWSADSGRIYFLRNYGGQASLWVVDVQDGRITQMDTSPFTWLKQLSASPVSDEIALIASSSQHPERVIRWDGKRWRPLAYNAAWMFPPEVFSKSQQVTWQSLDGVDVHGIYYPPHLAGVHGEGTPPLIVNVHGGPTSQVAMEFPREAHYFTTRGYAWLDVNYRGSAGLGRSYQDALAGHWGELDVMDAVSAAQSFAERGLADPARMVIHGGSAGGFTVLNALVQHPGVFKAGIALYPVTNLLTIDNETHKFESHYTEWLVGKLPDYLQRYQDYSPLFHFDKVQDALLIFHGEEDRVVPLEQSQLMVNRLIERGIDIQLILYPGEGHGFRLPSSISDYFSRIEEFLAKRLLDSVDKPQMDED